MSRIRAWLRWVGVLLMGWGEEPVPQNAYIVPYLDADALRKVFIRPPSLPTTCPLCSVSWRLHHCPEPTLAVKGRVCEICGVDLPIDATPNHNRKYRCRLHKGDRS